MSKIGDANLNAEESLLDKGLDPTPENKTNELFDRVSKGMQAVAKTIDTVKPQPIPAPTPAPTPATTQPQPANIQQTAYTRPMPKIVKKTAPVKPSRSSAENAKKVLTTDRMAMVLANLIEYVETTHNCIELEGLNGKTERYVRASGWQYLGHLMGVTMRCDVELDYENTLDASGDDVDVRAIATCELIDKDGNIVGKGVMQATNAETFLMDKVASATMGLAQTRAMVRAIKNSYSFVMEMAGYAGTPYEEIKGKIN